MRIPLLAIALLSIAPCAAQVCNGTIEYMSAYGACAPVVQPRFVGRIAVEGATDTVWYSVRQAGYDTVWAKVSSGWIEYVNDSCARERIVKYRLCDPTKPDTLYFEAFTNMNKNAVMPVNWRRVVGIRFTNLNLTKLPPDYERIAYLVNDATGVRFMPDGRWKMASGVYCSQFPAASTWKTAGIIPSASITFPAPVDIAYFLGRTANGAALQFECEAMQVLFMP